MKRSVIGLCSILAACAAAPAQTPTQQSNATPDLLGKASHEAKYVTGGVTFSIQLYSGKQPGGPTTLYAWPTFAFKADDDGKLAVHVEPPLVKGGKSAVRLTLLVNPAPVLNAAKAEFALKDEQVVNVLMKQASVAQEAGDGDAVFKPLAIKGETVASELTLVAYLPGEDADALAKGLREGRMSADFRVAGRLYSTRERGRAEGEVGVVKLRDIDAGTILLGTAGEGKIGTGGNAVTTQAAPVTRDQEEKLRARIKSDVVAKLKVTGDPAGVDKVHTMIDAYLTEHVFAKETPQDVTVESVLKLNRYGFDPSDLKPNVLTKTLADVKAFLADEKKETISFEAGGSVLGISAGAKYTKDKLVKHMEDRGFKFEQEGMIYVPRSISVRAVNRQAIEAHAGFGLTYSEEGYSHVDLETVINTRTRIRPDETLASHPSQLAEYARQLLALRGELDLLEAERVKLAEARAKACESLAWMKGESARWKAVSEDPVRYEPVRVYAKAFVDSMASFIEQGVKDHAEAQLTLDRHLAKQTPAADKVRATEGKVKALVGK
jgi:hypothetical protein